MVANMRSLRNTSVQDAMNPMQYTSLISRGTPSNSDPSRREWRGVEGNLRAAKVPAALSVGTLLVFSAILLLGSGSTVRGALVYMTLAEWTFNAGGTAPSSVAPVLLAGNAIVAFPTNSSDPTHIDDGAGGLAVVAESGILVDVTITNNHPTENVLVDNFSFRYRTLSGSAIGGLFLDQGGILGPSELNDSISFDTSWRTFEMSDRPPTPGNPPRLALVAPGQSARFFIQHFESDPGALTVFDDIRIEGRAVPEASGAALLALGAAALTLRRRRRGD